MISSADTRSLMLPGLFSHAWRMFVGSVFSLSGESLLFLAVELLFDSFVTHAEMIDHFNGGMQ